MLIPFRTALVALVVAWLVAPAAVRAQDAADLVKKLGDPAFAVREQALAGLVKLGKDALPALEAGATSDDREVRDRCRRLQESLKGADPDPRVEAFLAGQGITGGLALPGWTAFNGLAGDDAPARHLYLRALRADAELLKTLERDPKAAAVQALEHARKQMAELQKGQMLREKRPPANLGGMAAIVTVLGAASGGGDTTADNQLNGLFSQPAMQSAVRSDPAARRLLGAWYERRATDPVQFVQTGQAWMIASLGLTELIDRRFRPAAEKFAAEVAANPADLSKFHVVVNLATTFQMHDLMEKTLKPAVRRALEQAARETSDFNKLNQAFGLATSLRMDDDLARVMRPPLTRMAERLAAQPTPDMNLFYQLQHMAQRCCPDLVVSGLQPAARRQLMQAVSGPLELQRFQQALNLARSANLNDDVEGLLKPAGEALLRDLIEARDPGSLQNAMHLAATLGLKAPSIEKAARKLLEEQAQKPADLARLAQAVALARSCNVEGLPELLEKTVKPALGKALRDAAERAPDAQTAQQGLNLARELQSKDGLPLACKVAQARGLPGYARGMALSYVAQFGGPDQVPLLESLFDDSTHLGTSGINGMTITCQARDVALAVAVHQSGQKIEDYDYPYLKVIRIAPQQLFAQSSYAVFGFASEDARTAAQRRWRESRQTKTTKE